jgi:hypothetical protein
MPSSISTSDFLGVTKRPIPVAVEFAQADGTVETLEGPVRCLRGDAIITGVKGERWPVQKSKFLENYLAVAPTVNGQSGTYLKKVSATWAKKMDQPFSVVVGSARDSIQGVAGDWLVLYADGSQGVVRADIFLSTYRIL